MGIAGKHLRQHERCGVVMQSSCTNAERDRGDESVKTDATGKPKINVVEGKSGHERNFLVDVAV